MARRTGLGRGLDALIPGEDQLSTGGVLLIAVDQISPNPRQPRNRMDEDELHNLADSIREHGVIQPLLVTSDPAQPDLYILIAGERRWLAARQAGFRTSACYLARGH
jgi:ParB family transcriptional regulator, chromosome partitioning protein